MGFEFLSELTKIECFARGSGIRDIRRLRQMHGEGVWFKCKGFARIRLDDGLVTDAEIHWYQPDQTGEGRVEFKIKRLLP